MTKPSNINQVKALPSIPYADLRASLRTGDLLFAAGNYAFSRTIRQVTESPWSHVGLIVRMLDRVLLLESIETVGVRLAPLSKYIVNYKDDQPYDGVVAFARRMDMTEQQANQAICYGLDALTRPYNHVEVIDIVYRAMMKQPREVDDCSARYLCSELVHYCLHAAKLDLWSDPCGFIGPNDLWRHPQVSLLGRVALGQESIAA